MVPGLSPGTGVCSSTPWPGVATWTPAQAAGSPSPSSYWRAGGREGGKEGERQGAREPERGASRHQLAWKPLPQQRGCAPWQRDCGVATPPPPPPLHAGWGRGGKYRPSGWAGCACLHGSSRVGGGGERFRGHELAPTWLQSSQQGS
jgi:hypothetical protein